MDTDKDFETDYVSRALQKITVGHGAMPSGFCDLAIALPSELQHVLKVLCQLLKVTPVEPKVKEDR